MEYTLEALGQVIQELRVANALTQDRLGTEAGYHAGAGVSISRIENGLTRPGAERFAGIARVLGMTPGQLEAAAAERTRKPLVASVDSPGRTDARARREQLDDRWNRIRQEIERRDAVKDLIRAFEEASERSAEAFVIPFFEIAGSLNAAPLPEVAILNEGVVTDAATEAVFRLRLASRGVAQEIALGATGPAVAVAPEIGRAAAQATYRAVVAYGRASTGLPISSLYGIAQESAAFARLGRGPLASGGAGVAGGKRLLGGINDITLLLVAVAPLVVAALLSRKEQQRIAAHLDRLEPEVMATQRGIDALQDMLPRATQVLDEIAVHGGRALQKWAARIGPRPLEWESLDPGEKQCYLDFVDVSACHVMATSIDILELVESRGPEREALIELADELLNKSQELVDSRV